MKTSTQNFVDIENGLTAIELSLIASLIAVAVATAVTWLA